MTAMTNTHAITGTAVTPYELVFGRKPCDPNMVAVQDGHLWGPKADKKYLSPKGHITLRRARMANVHSQAIMQRLDVIKKNQSQVRKMQYSQKYEVGDYLLRWTANPKVGVYGKLAFKTTGPYEVLSVHPRNPDVYQIRAVGNPNGQPVMTHTRELVPYVTREAHEQQKQTDVVQENDELLEVKPGDHLLLRYGRRDFLTKVLTKSGPYVEVQYYNTEGKDKDRDLRLVWYRQDPSVEGEAYQEIFKDQPSRSELQQGYVPWTERIHLNQFYQRIVEDKDMKISKDGRRITPLRKAAIRKSGPIEMADES